MIRIKSYDNSFEPFDLPIQRADSLKEEIARNLSLTKDRLVLCGNGKVIDAESDISDLESITVVTRLLVSCQVLNDEKTRHDIIVPKGADHVALKKHVDDAIGCPARSYICRGKMLRDVKIEDGDCIIVVPKSHCIWRMLWTFIRIRRYVSMIWMNPWKLVEPSRTVVQRPRRQHVNMTPLTHQAMQYTPGTNPHGEDLTLILTQGMF